MNNDTKLALFDGLWNWFVQTYATVDATAKALASDSLHSAHVDRLNDSIDSAKICTPSISYILDCLSAVL